MIKSLIVYFIKWETSICLPFNSKKLFFFAIGTTEKGKFLFFFVVLSNVDFNLQTTARSSREQILNICQQVYASNTMHMDK